MSKPLRIKIDLHNRDLWDLTAWHGHEGLLLTINGNQIIGANDEDSRRYLMERVLKAVRDSAYRLMHPEEEEE